MRIQVNYGVITVEQFAEEQGRDRLHLPPSCRTLRLTFPQVWLAIIFMTQLLLWRIFLGDLTLPHDALVCGTCDAWEKIVSYLIFHWYVYLFACQFLARMALLN